MELIKIEKTCVNCGVSIAHLKSTAKYCSVKCKEQAARRSKLVMTTCTCGCEFLPTHGKQKYCGNCNSRVNAIVEKQNAKRSSITLESALTRPVKIKSIDGEAIKHGSFVKKIDGSILPASHYVMLQADGVKPLLAPCLTDSTLPVKRLTTSAIFNWLASDEFTYTKLVQKTNRDGKPLGKPVKKKTAYTIVGYYLNYDFENWLADVPNDDYLKLVEGEIIEFDGWKVSLIPKKMMHIWKEKQATDKSTGEPLFDSEGLPKMFKTIQRDVYDTASYWARPFVGVLAANEDLITEEEQALISKFKAMRNVFTIDSWQEIAEYNQLECALLTRITDKLVLSMQSGFPNAGIKIPVLGRDLYSPKALSNKFFKAIKWNAKHPLLKWRDGDKEKFAATLNGFLHNDDATLTEAGEILLAFPFIAAYFGGRIESAQVGTWLKAHGVDINSAYPAALAKIMEWLESDMFFCDDETSMTSYLASNIAGMVLLQWDFREELAFYPFPFRDGSNVFFPAQGNGWVSNLEYYSWRDSCRNNKQNVVTVKAGLLLENTEGFGNIQYLEEGFNDSNKEWWKFYNARLEMKRKEFTSNVTGEVAPFKIDDSFEQTKFENPAEYAVKIVYNAAYGGTIQQVGVKDWKAMIEQDATKKKAVFNDFVGMWITSYCRATIWQAIAPHVHNPKAIIAIQTDGIYSTVELDVPAPKQKILGLWEKSVLYDYSNLQSGIYQYREKPDGKMKFKQRGWGKGFSHEQALHSLKTGKHYSVDSDAFIARGFALHQHLALEGCSLQWISSTKEFVCSLGSKRQSPAKIVLKNAANKYFKPKRGYGIDTLSTPFNLKFESVNKGYFNDTGLNTAITGNEDYRPDIQE